MKRVYLITGAAGHLAQTTIARLRRQNCFIRGLILPGEKPVEIASAHLSYYTGDVTMPDTLDPFFFGLDDCEVIVIHMAAVISIQDRPSPDIINVNVNGTGNIIRKCRQYHAKRLIYVSSVHSLPPSPDGSVMKEVSHFSEHAVAGAYAKTKALATQMVLDAGKAGKDKADLHNGRTGLEVVVVHPSAILGPGDGGRNHVIQMMQMYLRRRLPMGVPGGYDFVDVRDVADGIVSAVDRGRNGECYLLTNRYAAISDLLEYMRIATGRRFRPICCPIWLARAALPFINGFARLKGTRPIFTKYALQTLNSNQRFSHEKAARELDYHPRDLKITVADTISYLQNR